MMLMSSIEFIGINSNNYVTFKLRKELRLFISRHLRNQSHLPSHNLRIEAQLSQDTTER